MTTSPLQTAPTPARALPRVSIRREPAAPKERSRIRARIREEQEARREELEARRDAEALEEMLADNTPDPRRGRPPLVLYPSVAAEALEELEVYKRSYGAVAKRCKRKKPWLIAAHKSGRLKLMAEGRMGQPTGP